MKYLALLLGVVSLGVQAQVTITPQVLGKYLSAETKQTCQVQKTFEHGEVKRLWKTAHAYSVQCQDGRQYAVAIETNQEQTAWWVTCEVLAKQTSHQCFKKSSTKENHL